MMFNYPTITTSQISPAHLSFNQPAIMQRQLTLMDVLRPSCGIRAIFNALLDGHRLHNDPEHQRWQQELARDPSGQLKCSYLHLSQNPRRTHAYINKRRRTRQTPCFAYSPTHGIHVLPTFPNKDGFVWIVEMQKGRAWTLYRDEDWNAIRDAYIVMRAICADPQTAVMMRNNYIRHGYYPQTDQLRLANQRAKLEEEMFPEWKQKQNSVLSRNGLLYAQRDIFYRLPVNDRQECMRNDRELHKTRMDRLHTWLHFDRQHRPRPDAQLVAATGLTQFCL